MGDVDTFALQNILFYENSLCLNTGSLPGDLVLNGSVAPVIALTPDSIAVEPGGDPVQFTATLNGQSVDPSTLDWRMLPVSGTLKPDGTYEPPPTITRPHVVVVTASSGQVAGRAMVLVYAPQPSNGLSVGPPNAVDDGRAIGAVRGRGRQRQRRERHLVARTSRWQHGPDQRRVDVHGAGVDHVVVCGEADGDQHGGRG